jgi:hypothetical protein
VRLRDLGRLWAETHARYLSPERRAGGARSAQDDLYALGVILLEAALGEPFELSGPDGTLDPRVLDGLIPDRLIDALAALLAPIDRRIQTADAVVRIFSGLEGALGDGADSGAVTLRLAVAHAKELEPPTPAPQATGSIEPDTLESDDTIPLAPIIPLTPHLPRSAPTRAQPALKSLDPASIPPRSDPGPSWDEVGPPGGHKSPVGMIVMGGLVGLVVVAGAALQLGVLDGGGASADAARADAAAQAIAAALIPPVDLDAPADAAPVDAAAAPTPEDDAQRVVAALRAAAAQAHGIAEPPAAAEAPAAPARAQKQAPRQVQKEAAKAQKKLAKAAATPKQAPPRPAKAEKPSKVAKPAPTASDGAGFFAAESTPPELTLDASAGMRKRAEEKLASCHITKPVFGVVHVGGGKIRVSTDPKNACVERVLAPALKGYMASEDQPFELSPR